MKNLMVLLVVGMATLARGDVGTWSKPRAVPKDELTKLGGFTTMTCVNTTGSIWFDSTGIISKTFGTRQLTIYPSVHISAPPYKSFDVDIVPAGEVDFDWVVSGAIGLYRNGELVKSYKSGRLFQVNKKDTGRGWLDGYKAAPKEEISMAVYNALCDSNMTIRVTANVKSGPDLDITIPHNPEFTSLKEFAWIPANKRRAARAKASALKEEHDEAKRTELTDKLAKLEAERRDLADQREPMLKKIAMCEKEGYTRVLEKTKVQLKELDEKLAKLDKDIAEAKADLDAVKK